jgi:hypothetical protein
MEVAARTEELAARLRGVGLLCHVQSFDKTARIIVGKLGSIPGNSIPGYRGAFMGDGPECDGPSPYIKIEDGVITFATGTRVPGPPDAYQKELTTLDELYEELVHYYFDPDSPMSAEPGFVAGPGRVTGA